ncbi:MAG: hypothetical protein JXR70_17425 [Spirochaetales bacterium]|nr:hypothetical protein [Spirochaetales bacterium]
MKKKFLLFIMLVSIMTGLDAQQSSDRIVVFGTLLDPQAQMAESKELAQSIANPGSPGWRAKGDQHRSYYFPAANTNVGYRLCVPNNWDGVSELPLVMFLHGAGSDENSYVDANNKQMITLANQHGYILLAPLGYQGAYGTILRLPAVFGQSGEADKMIAKRTPEIERTQQLSEKDVINVLEIVCNEYPVKRDAMFLSGHSMGSGGTWYLGAKYSFYWLAIAPLSGPFVQESGYPWDNLLGMPLHVSEGTNTPSLDGSRALNHWLISHGFDVTYVEVNADHGGMIPLVLPGIYDFFDKNRANMLTALPTPESTPSVLMGDVNRDENINIVDALLIAQRYVRIIPDVFFEAAADVNCSHSIDIVDALLIAQYYVKLIVAFPCN